jgi:hypothetical protein
MIDIMQERFMIFDKQRQEIENEAAEHEAQEDDTLLEEAAWNFLQIKKERRSS